MKKIVSILGVISILSLTLLNVGAIETRAGIEYNTTTTKATFTGSLGYANFYSIMRYNNNTGEVALTDHYSKGYPKSTYKFSTNNNGAGEVTNKNGQIIVTWKRNLRDSKSNLVDSGTEQHKH